MRGRVIAFAVAGLAFDLGAFVKDVVQRFQVTAAKPDVAILNGTLLVPEHAYGPNIFDRKVNPAIPEDLGYLGDGADLKPVKEGDFNLITSIINTLVVVEFERKRALPLDLVDGRLPLNPQSFSSIGVKTKQPRVERAQLLKLYSAGAYCNETSLAAWDCGENCAGPANGTRLVKYISNAFEQTAGFVALNDREKLIVVAFRGSSNLNNWINNAMMLLVPFDIAEIKNCTIKNPLRVHRGFQIMARSLYARTRSTLVPLLKQYPNYRVAITGHSAGGAIATLATVALGGSGVVPFNRITLITFGQPRVGDTAFTSYLNSQSLFAARVTNGVDPVNILPTQEMGFHHNHNEFFLVRTNGIDNLRKCVATSHTESPECARFDVVPKRLNGHFEYFGRLNTQCT